MKISLDRQAFLEALSTASAAASGQVKDVLGKVLFDAAFGTLEASNGESPMIVVVDMAERSSGTCLLDPRRVLSILKESRDESVTIEADERSIEIETGGASYKLQATNPDEFPRIRSSNTEAIEVDAKRLLEALGTVDYACDVDSTRYQLGGVNFVSTEGLLELVATDGRRLAYSSVPAGPGASLAGQSNIVPAKALGLVKRAIEGANGEIGIAVSGNGIEFRSGSVTVKTILVEGRYPNWQSVIPKAEGVAIGFQSEPFLRAVKQASIVADKESSGVVFAFTPGDCTLSTRTADVGQSKVSVPVECDGEITLTMDYRFVSQWLASLPKDSEVTLRASSKSAPTLWASGNAKYVIMPMERN